MPIIQANPDYEPQIRHLLRKGRHIFASFGNEDLTTLLEKPLTLLAEEKGSVWGFLNIEIEERPPTLPSAAAQRAYLRALVLAQGRSPSQDIPLLMEAALQTLNRAVAPLQIIVYGGETWLTKPLLAMGFDLTERVEFLALDLTRYPTYVAPPPTVAQLRPMHPNDIPTVAELDATAFEPLWHFGVKDLWELMFRSRLQVATIDEQPVGYSALSANGTSKGAEAQLARLAVSPTVQGQGIGRQLLIDAIAYARANRFAVVSLNTQTTNQRAQKLYRQLGFRPTGFIVPVLTKTVALSGLD
ncbi:MAG: GNAT family N-acetyltransferase [Chloroflexi bacterium]|nr:GNAT family N-acetyltransferase [Chloroflexota bacterium]